MHRVLEEKRVERSFLALTCLTCAQQSMLQMKTSCDAQIHVAEHANRQARTTVASPEPTGGRVADEPAILHYARTRA